MSENNKQEHYKTKGKRRKKKSSAIESKNLPTKVGRRRKKIKNQEKTKVGFKNIWLGLLAFLTSALLSLTVFLIIYSFVKVDDNDMSPSLTKGQVVIVNKKITPRRNSVVLVKHQTETVVSRLVGLPGDVISYQEGKLIVNGVERLQTSVSLENQLATKDFENESPIPTNSFYILGDNREVATDSRKMGLINEDKIIGVVETVILP